MPTPIDDAATPSLAGGAAAASASRAAACRSTSSRTARTARLSVDACVSVPSTGTDAANHAVRPIGCAADEMPPPSRLRRHWPLTGRGESFPSSAPPPAPGLLGGSPGSPPSAPYTGSGGCGRGSLVVPARSASTLAACASLGAAGGAASAKGLACAAASAASAALAASSIVEIASTHSCIAIWSSGQRTYVLAGVTSSKEHS